MVARPGDVAPLRADARRNRDKIIATARALYAKRGLEVSMKEIARSAEVGTGTLYRHFAAQSELIATVYMARAAQHIAAIERAGRHADPWQGFVEFIRETCHAQAADRGMADLTATGNRSPALRALRTGGDEGLAALIDRAKAGGQLRADFSPEDLILLYVAIAGITRHAGPAAPAAADRFVALILDGFRAAPASAGAPPPIAPGA